MKKSILIADDEANVRFLFNELLREKYSTFEATNGQEAIHILNNENIDLAILDIRMPKKSGLDVLDYISSNKIDLIPLVITANKDLSTAVKAMKLGAYDYIIKPFDNKKILLLIEHALEKRALEKGFNSLMKDISKKYSFNNIIGKSPQMAQVFKLLSKVIDQDTTVLIRGESGTGKELIARAIHYNSKRKNRPFIPVDCATIPDTLIENELFGHEKGAYTGALSKKVGKFEIANTGTLFLDEIGNLRMDVQAKLLRVLQERTFTRVGGNKTFEVDIRIVAATNIDLEKLIKQGKFREDLYYRLNVIPINLPRLKDRDGDIDLLINHFLEKFSKELNKNLTISPQAREKLLDYSWPGNIRELENVIQRLVIVADNQIIKADELKFLSNKETNNEIKPGKTLDEIEKIYIEDTLSLNNGNITKSAIMLGISRKTLHNKIKKYKINIVNTEE